MHPITKQRFEELFPSDSDDDTLSDDISFDELEEELKGNICDDEVTYILANGIKRKDYINGVENKMGQIEKSLIQDYIEENDNFELLYAKIDDCDLVFSEIASFLSKFEAHIGLLSSEIRNLRDESTDIGIKLKNRKLAEEKLAKFLEEIIPPPSMVDIIIDGEVNEEYLKNMEVLSKKIKFVEVNERIISSKALKDVKPELEMLRQKAVSKIFEFITNLFDALANYNTNIQIMQQNVLLKYKYIIIFLEEHDKERYKNVCTSYADTMNKVLSRNFGVYIQALERLQLEISSSNHISEFESKNKYFNFNLKKDEKFKKRSSIFSLGGRIDILKEINESALVPDILEGKCLKYPYEALFRSLLKLLLDTASSEYLFVKAFFQDESLFSQIFAGSFEVINEHLNKVVYNCYDAICLMLIICITRKHQLKMQSREIPCLDSYLDKVFISLWPRFKMVLDMHLQSLLKCDVKTIWENDVHPHHIIRCYAEFIASLIQLNSEYGHNQLGINLERLRLALDSLLIKLAVKFRRLKLQNLFLLNNYDMIIGILKEAGVGNGEKGLVFFEEKLESNMISFVEELLRDHFGNLINYVRDYISEDLISYKNQPTITNIEPILKEFSLKWKNILEKMHREVITNCSNLLCGMEILKAAMAQILNYYNRLSECVKFIPGGSVLNKHLVSITSISYEIRKYSRSL